jgi:hypothetical protein
VVDLLHEIEQALQQTQPPGAAAAAEITGDPGDRRSEDRKDQQTVEDVVAVFVEERFLIVGQVRQPPGCTTTLASLSVAGAWILISPGMAAASAYRDVKISLASVPIASWLNGSL